MAKSKNEEYEIPLKAQDKGTELSQTVAVTSLQFRRTNQDYYLDWHPASRRQYVVTLSGESEVELEGGKKIRLGPGHILLAEDTTGQGHISRAIGSKDRVSLFIPLADGATSPLSRGLGHYARVCDDVGRRRSWLLRCRGLLRPVEARPSLQLS